MPSPLFLLLTILTAPAVPRLLDEGRLGQPALPSPVGPSSAVECRLRVGPTGVPLVRVEVVAGHVGWFVVDTGATGTTLHTDLARRLGLQGSGQANLTTVEGSVRVPTVRLPGLRIVGLPTTHDVDAAVHDLKLVRQVAPQAEGILGQDVLAAYDYLIDHARQRLTIGRFAPPADGALLPLTWSLGRPVLHVEGGDHRYGLVLDTGSDVLLMEAGAALETLGDVPPAGRTRALLQTHVGTRAVDVEHHVGLRLANVSLPRVALVRLPADAWQMSPEVGLLPASLFSRVYVSARTGEAVVWTK